MNMSFDSLGIVGAGAMGRGIAQIAAQAGSTVYLFDTKHGAADMARAHIQQQWQRQVDKGRIESAQAAAWLSKLVPVASLHELAACRAGCGGYRRTPGRQTVAAA